jgi:integrase
VDIERYARQLEARGLARATVARRLSTVAGFYRYAEQEGLIARSPAVHVRRPRLDYESHTVGLDRNELGAVLVAAGLAGATEHALVSLLGLNGLRISEALGADIDDPAGLGRWPCGHGRRCLWRRDRHPARRGRGLRGSARRLELEGRGDLSTVIEGRCVLVCRWGTVVGCY